MISRVVLDFRCGFMMTNEGKWRIDMKALDAFVVVAFLISVLAFNGSLADDVGVQKFPNVVNVTVRTVEREIFDFDVTVSSPYDSMRRYADAFRVVDSKGRVFGERKLLHDHADEQPFTRDLRGVKISTDVREVIVQARDSTYGYGGKTMVVILPGR